MATIRDINDVDPICDTIDDGDYVKCGYNIYEIRASDDGMWDVLMNGALVAQEFRDQEDLYHWLVEAAESGSM